MIFRFLLAWTICMMAAPGVLLAADEAESGVPQNECLNCHRDNEYLPEDYKENDVHLKLGLTCASCHGGDPTSDDDEVAMSEAAGFIGVPKKADIPHFCGRCHSDIKFMRKYRPRIETDQETQYFTSVHGQRLLKGDKKVADCTSCHTAHAILPASDTRSTVHPLNVPSTCNKCHGDADYMREYGIPTNQYAEYAKGVHGVALLQNQDTSAPACNDCHGNHGAVPPGVNSIRQVCGSCHVNNMSYFTASIMGAAFKQRDLHGCEECHSNHNIHKTSDAMVGDGAGAVCIRCHSESENPKGYIAAGKIHSSLVSLVASYEAADSMRKEVGRIGMDDVDIVFALQDAHQSLIQARTLVHTFDPKRVAEETDAGEASTKHALELAASEIKDYHVRRRGFGMATIFITILVVALFLKIRQIERP